MKYIKGFFITLGVLFFFILSLSIGASYIAFTQKQSYDLPNQFTVTLDLKTPLPEEKLFSLSPKDNSLSLHSFISSLNDIAQDDRVKGVYVRLIGKDFTITQIEEIAPALQDIKASGKILKLYTEDLQSYTNSTVIFALTSHFDEVWMQPVGSAYIPPLKLEMPFLKTTFDLVGITPEFERRKDYKTAPELFLKDKPSEENIEMMTRLAKQLDGSLVDMIKANKPETKFKDVRKNIVLNAYELLDAKLVTRLGFYDEFVNDLEKTNTQLETKSVPFTHYQHAMDQASRKKFDAEKTPKVAFLLMQGMITSPEFSDVSADNKRSALGADTIIDPIVYERALNKIAQDKNISSVLIRIDSPGGTPTGAETIRRAIENVKKAGKKVYISMGSMAASGGYWIALEGDLIYANPSTLTGSIGVYGGKFTLSGLMNKIGVNWHAVHSDETIPSNYFSMNFPMTAKDKTALNKSMDFIYNTFLERVSSARNIEIQKLDQEIAGGRVWTGNDAFRLGLIDHVGGMRDVINQIKLDTGLMEEDDLLLIRYPEPKSPLEEFLNLADDFMQSKVMIDGLFSSAKTYTRIYGAQSVTMDDRL